MAQIVAFRARDSRARFECLRHAVEARRLQDAVVERRRTELLGLAERVGREVELMTREERIARIRQLGPFDPIPESDVELFDEIVGATIDKLLPGPSCRNRSGWRPSRNFLPPTGPECA